MNGIQRFSGAVFAPYMPAVVGYDGPAFALGICSRRVSDVAMEMDAIVSAAETETRPLTAAEVESYGTLETELQTYQASDNIQRIHAARRAPVIDGFPATITATPTGDAAEAYAFDQYLRTGTPNSDLRAAETYSQNEGTTTAGGFAVPDTFLSRITEKMTAFGGLLNAAEQLVTSDGRPLQWPTLDAVAYTQADIAAELAATAAGADLVFGEVTLGAYKYTSAGASNLPVKVSVELLQDASIDIGALVARKLGERIYRKMAYDVINGSGSGEPQGIAYGTAGTVEHDPDGFAAFSNVVHSLDPFYRDQGASWIMNDTTLKNIEQLLDGASGTSGRPMLVPSLQGIEGKSSHGLLLGYPIIIDQAMPTWAADNVIGAGFGVWDQAYVVRRVKDVNVLVNPYADAGAGYVTYHAWARMDGKVQNSAAYVTGEGT